MGIGVESKEKLTGEISEAELGLYFQDVLMDHGERIEFSFGERIEFSFGERPVRNLFKGKGIVRTSESITDWTSLVVETDKFGRIHLLLAAIYWYGESFMLMAGTRYHGSIFRVCMNRT